MQIVLLTYDYRDMCFTMKQLYKLLCAEIDYHIEYKNNQIKIKDFDTVILGFTRQSSDRMLGLRPDYYWSHDFELGTYFRSSGAKYLDNIHDIVEVVITESITSDENTGCIHCRHHGHDYNIAGTTCYNCKRNPTDHRIDWYEEKTSDGLNVCRIL